MISAPPMSSARSRASMSGAFKNRIILTNITSYRTRLLSHKGNSLLPNQSPSKYGLLRGV